MNGILNDDEYIEVEGRAYANPDLPVQETNRFIENLRSVQQGNNAEIAAQTEALGTAVPSNLGGLLGGEGYWTSRLQTPQTNTLAQNLRTAAQASALSQALENEQALWKERYQNAYRNYQSRQNARANYGTNSPSTQNTTANAEPDITEENTTVEISDIQTEAFANSRYKRLLMNYLQAGYPAAEAEARAKADFGKSVSVNAPVEPYKKK